MAVLDRFFPGDRRLAAGGVVLTEQEGVTVRPLAGGRVEVVTTEPLVWAAGVPAPDDYFYDPRDLAPDHERSFDRMQAFLEPCLLTKDRDVELIMTPPT